VPEQVGNKLCWEDPSVPEQVGYKLRWEDPFVPERVGNNDIRCRMRT
jgi:hypothetical protein